MSTAGFEDVLALVEQAGAQGHLSHGAAEHIRTWLTQPRYAPYAPLVADHVRTGQWQVLDDVFWTIIPFGTGGRRGRLYPIGTNAINDRTMGESAQGLAEYVKEHFANRELRCAMAYDTRHRSREFAELCSEVMVANGFQVYFLDGYRSTPELSFAVRYKECVCGIMITASHNPPTDNAIKVYWATGGQLLPPHDHGVIERVMGVTDIRRVPFAEAVASGRVVFCQGEVDAAFIRAVVAQSRPGPRNLRIIYSPLHGVGASAVLPALQSAGFRDVELFAPHAEPHPDFPNVPDHIANPERAEVFDAIIEHARQVGADLILATDPDCDRLGCAAPQTLDPSGPWGTLTGNQIGALLAEYLLEAGRAAGTLTSEHYLVKTLVTTELIRRIGDAYGVQTIGDLLVGFKYIGGVIEERDPKKFILGAEESYGFLVGDHARDKDGAVAAMLVAELAARAKAEGLSLHQKLASLFRRYGCHAEGAFSIIMPGSEGMARMQELMARFRKDPPTALGGLPVVQIRDYLSNAVRQLQGPCRFLAGPTGDLVMLDLAAEGNSVAVRPSGTEPKIKFYLFAFEPPEAVEDVSASRQRLSARLKQVEDDLKHYAGLC